MNHDRIVLQQFANTHSMRSEILSQMVEKGLEGDCYVEMLDYTIDLFESQGLGTEYYGYHNINHELEVTYVTLLATNQDKVKTLFNLFFSIFFQIPTPWICCS